MRPLLALLALFLPLAASAPAVAGSYVSLGVGAPANVGGGLKENFPSQDNDLGTLRVAMGFRLGPIALEGAVLGTELGKAGGDRQGSMSAGGSLKYFIGLPVGLELYLRGGMHQAWLVNKPTDIVLMSKQSGTGYDYGAGLQFNVLPIPLLSAAVWLDFTRQQVNVSSGSSEPRLDGALNMVTVGVSVGF